MSKKRSNALAVVPDNPRLERANYCTFYLQRFEHTVHGWQELAVVLVEVERDELFQEVGCESWDEWARKNAPVSYRLCYAVKRRYNNLKAAGLSDSDMKLMPAQTADWASKSKNISPVELKKPRVREALSLPKQKAVELLREVLPDQHIEEVKVRHCKFAVSADIIIQEGYEVFKKHKDEWATFEDFLEFVVSEWILSFA